MKTWADLWLGHAQFNMVDDGAVHLHALRNQVRRFSPTPKADRIRISDNALFINYDSRTICDPLILQIHAITTRDLAFRMKICK